MLPKRLYELLPYFYMVSAVVVLLTISNYVALFSGLTLFMAGSLIWILRSDHRRATRKQRGRVPYWIYELQPFIYAVGGLTLWLNAQSMYFYPSAVVLTVTGLQIWYLRSTTRQHRVPVNNRALI